MAIIPIMVPMSPGTSPGIVHWFMSRCSSRGSLVDNRTTATLNASNTSEVTKSAFGISGRRFSFVSVMPYLLRRAAPGEKTERRGVITIARYSGLGISTSDGSTSASPESHLSHASIWTIGKDFSNASSP